MKDYSWFEEWLNTHEIIDKDKKSKYNSNNFSHSTMEDYLTAKKIKLQPKKKMNRFSKFQNDDPEALEKWLDKYGIIDKDKEHVEKKLRAYPPYIGTKYLKIEATLDLHHQTEKEAINSLHKFIIESFHKGLLVVKIIHGKGLHSQGAPKIKKAVKHWLFTYGKKYIRYIKSAEPNQGGTGALIVWLQ